MIEWWRHFVTLHTISLLHGVGGGGGGCDSTYVKKNVKGKAVTSSKRT